MPCLEYEVWLWTLIDFGTRLDCPRGLQEIEASRIFRQSAHDGDKAVSLTHRPPLIPREDPWYIFLLETESTPGLQCDRKDRVNEKSHENSSGIFLVLPLFFICSSVSCLYWLLPYVLYCTTHTTQTSMSPAGFEPAIPVSDRPQTLALDRSATEIG